MIYRHALRNALLPVVTIIGLQMALMLGGSAVVETVFSWPGLGSAIVQSSATRDYPVILGIMLLISVSVVVVTTATDVVYSALDPRIK